MARESKFHGRIEREEPCAEPGCLAPGEIRAPDPHGAKPGFDGPGDYRWLCLDHVREFNTGYNYYRGMSPEEIEDAQTLFGGWDRETRAFATNGDPAPRWADFRDPIDAIGARFGRGRRPLDDHLGRRGNAATPSGRFTPSEMADLRVLGLGDDADRRGLRTRYAELVRRYHPDRNGGDRRHEKALGAVIAAYERLKSSRAFA